MVSQRGIQPLTFGGFLFTSFFLADAYFDYSYAALLLAAAVVLPLIWLLFRSSRELIFINWSWTLMGLLYMGWMLSYWVALRGFDQGKGWVFFTLFSTFACDTGAFLVGRSWGRHPLAPVISPGKTWEGAIGGFLAAPAAAAILYLLLDMVGLTLPLSFTGTVLLGCLIGVFSQLGDLAESTLKRSMGVKDSGTLIPGHGGVLDRVDSIAFTGAVVYYYVTCLAR